MNVQAGQFTVAEFIASPIEDSVIVEVKETGDVHELNGVAGDILVFCKTRYDLGFGFSTDDIVDFIFSSYNVVDIPRDKVQNDVEAALNRFVSVGLVKIG